MLRGGRLSTNILPEIEGALKEPFRAVQNVTERESSRHL
jgi:hypothetical protein